MTDIDPTVYRQTMSARYQQLVGSLVEEIAALEAYTQQQASTIQELRTQVALYTEQAWETPPVEEGTSQ